MRVIDDDDQRMRLLFDRYSSRVYAYALRHCGPDHAEDVVSETFLVAWRRLHEVPDDPLPWLLVVARNMIANRRRAEVRRLRLTDTLGRVVALQPHVRAVDGSVVDRHQLVEALGALSAVEREVLLLVAWDGLSHRDAARVADCSVSALRLRLHRGRKHLAHLLEQVDDCDKSNTETLNQLAAQPVAAYQGEDS